jgi:hypothetical protein
MPLPVMEQTKFYICIKQQALLQLCILLYALYGKEIINYVGISEFRVLTFSLLSQITRT